MDVRIPALREGREETVEWTTAPGGGPYTLERRAGGAFSDPVRPGTWDERDARGADWDTLDRERLSWERWESGGTVTLLYQGEGTRYAGRAPLGMDRAEYRVTARGGERALSGVVAFERASPPVVSGEDGDLGRLYAETAAPLEVRGCYEDSVLRVVITLDGEEMERLEGLPSVYHGAARLTGERLAALTPETRHTLVITATDDLGLSAARRLTFTAVEDLRGSAVYYLLRDGVAVQRSLTAAPFEDYAAVGEHRYRVRAVDRFGGFSDSEEITIRTQVDCTTLAPAGDPHDMVRLRYRMEREPETASRLETGTRSYSFEGRRFSVQDTGGGAVSRWSASFSGETREEYDKLYAMSLTKQPVVYRDPFGNGALVSIDALPVRFRDLAADFTVEMTQLEETGGIGYD